MKKYSNALMAGALAVSLVATPVLADGPPVPPPAGGGSSASAPTHSHSFDALASAEAFGVCELFNIGSRVVTDRPLGGYEIALITTKCGIVGGATGAFLPAGIALGVLTSIDEAAGFGIFDAILGPIVRIFFDPSPTSTAIRIERTPVQEAKWGINPWGY